MLHLRDRINFSPMRTIALAGALLGISTLGFSQETSPAPLAPTTGTTAQPMIITGSGGMGEIFKMLDAKVDPEVIIAYIQNSPTSYRPSAADLIELRDKGASPEVLKALVQHAG